MKAADGVSSSQVVTVLPGVGPRRPLPPARQTNVTSQIKAQGRPPPGMAPRVTAATGPAVRQIQNPPPQNMQQRPLPGRVQPGPPPRNNNPAPTVNGSRPPPSQPTRQQVAATPQTRPAQPTAPNRAAPRIAYPPVTLKSNLAGQDSYNLLKGKPVGTFNVRQSSTQPGLLSVDYIGPNGGVITARLEWGGTNMPPLNEFVFTNLAQILPGVKFQTLEALSASPPQQAPAPANRQAPPPRAQPTPANRQAPPPRDQPAPANRQAPPPRAQPAPANRQAPPPRGQPVPANRQAPPPRTSPTPQRTPAPAGGKRKLGSPYTFDPSKPISMLNGNYFPFDPPIVNQTRAQNEALLHGEVVGAFIVRPGSEGLTIDVVEKDGKVTSVRVEGTKGQLKPGVLAMKLADLGNAMGILLIPYH